MIGKPRSVIAAMPSYRPGKDAKQAEAEHGISDAIKLASNETPWPPLDSIVEAATQAARGANRYADHRAGELRSKIADWRGLGADQVTVGAGSSGLLQQLALTYLDPGDEVLYPWRSFEVYPVYSRLVNASAVTTDLTAHRFDLDAVAAAVTDKTKLILLANPNNPTGTALPVADFGRLLRQVAHDVVVVLDEAYFEFMDPELGDSVQTLLHEHPHLVVLRTFSKAHGLAAFRVGYAMGHPEVIASIDKTMVPFAVNAVAQAAAAAAIDADDAIAERVAIIRSERSRVVAALAEAGWDLPDAQANFVYLPLGEATEAVHLDLEKAGIVARPFLGDGLRVTIGSPEHNDRFLAALGSPI